MKKVDKAPAKVDKPQGISAEAMAEGLGVDEETLAAWRKKGTGPAYIEDNGKILYTVAGHTGRPEKSEEQKA